MEVSTFPKLEFHLDIKFLGNDVAPDIAEKLCQKYDLAPKKRWAKKEHLFTSEKQVYNSQNIMKLWIRELIEIANAIHIKRVEVC